MGHRIRPQDGTTDRQLCLVEAVAAVLSDNQAPAHGVERAGGIGVAEGEPIGEKRERKRLWVAGGLGGVDQAVRGGHRLVSGTCDRQCDYEACPGECVRVAIAGKLGTAPLDPSFGLTDEQVHTAKPALDAERHLVAATADHPPASVAVADGLLDPSGHPALRRHHVQGGEPGVVDGAGGLDELFGRRTRSRRGGVVRVCRRR